VHVLYFDTEVHKAEVYEAGQPVALTQWAEVERTSRTASGGWTSVKLCRRPWFFLTDLCGALPREAPAYPVLWASTESRQAPFGQVIPMEAT
jgi:VWA-like domain (DUF2201)